MRTDKKNLMSDVDKYGFVYVWYDRKNKMFYVGCHWGLDTDSYVCSSERMGSAYRRRPQDFKRRIVARFYTNRTDLLTEMKNLERNSTI